MEILLNAGGSTGYMRNIRDDRSTGITINRMSRGIHVSLATMEYVWEKEVDHSVAPLGIIYNFREIETVLLNVVIILFKQFSFHKLLNVI